MKTVARTNSKSKSQANSFSFSDRESNQQNWLGLRLLAKGWLTQARPARRTSEQHHTGISLCNSEPDADSGLRLLEAGFTCLKTSFHLEPVQGSPHGRRTISGCQPAISQRRPTGSSGRTCKFACASIVEKRLGGDCDPRSTIFA